MPVRIYDIARKVGMESKEVLARARELGITTAKVASSSLDKITAEYLEEKLGYKHPPPTPPGEPTPAPPPAAPATVPPAAAPSPGTAPAPVPPTTPVSAVPPPAAPPLAATAAAAPSAPLPECAQPVPSPAHPESPGAPIPLPSPPETAAASPTGAPPPSPPVLEAQGGPAPGAGATALVPTTEAAPLTSAPDGGSVSSAAPDAKAPAIPAVGVPATPAPTAPPPPPPPPPPPKIGDKVGFIVLPTRTRPPDRGPGKAPSRPPGKALSPGAPQAREARAPQPPARPGAPAARGPAPAKPAETAKGPVLPKLTAAPDAVLISMRPPIILRELADQMKKKPFQLIADLMQMGIFVTVNQPVEPEVAQRICAKHGFRFEVQKRRDGAHPVLRPAKADEDQEDKPELLKPRAPVVTIMGHVDHGKTTLLDVIRKSNVAAGEAGGITQHIGAYTIACPHPERPSELRQITFLDTPGHAAFSSMRARGANVTDIVVLVVAANDGVMPQTLEALNHALAAKVPIVVAVNKCDHPNANSQKVRQQLADKGLAPDDWGGQTIFVDVSALKNQGVDTLLSMILFQAEMLELKANPDKPAKGNVIESGLEQGGPTATVLVRKGTLRVGDTVLCGVNYGRVRALINEENKRLKEAGPSVAVRLLGLNGVPEAGVEFRVEESERVARELCAKRSEEAKQQDKERRPKVTIENLFDVLDSETNKTLKVVVKADAQGSVEAIVEALKKIESTKVALEIIHHAVGTVTESDVVLASASKAVILGFHTRIDNGVAELAKHEGVQIKLYAIIYELIDQIKEAMAGLLDPLLKEVVFGAAEVRKVFALSKGGNVAGCVVASGRLVRGKARVSRRKNLLYEGLITTLRRFQDDVNEVRAGMECGIRLDGFDDFQEGDTIECYTIEKVAQKL